MHVIGGPTYVPKRIAVKVRRVKRVGGLDINFESITTSVTNSTIATYSDSATYTIRLCLCE